MPAHFYTGPAFIYDADGHLFNEDSNASLGGLYRAGPYLEDSVFDVYCDVIPIVPVCGACGWRFDVGDPITALHSTTRCGKIATRDASTYPQESHGHMYPHKDKEGYTHHAFPLRQQCPLPATIHKDCLNLFMDLCPLPDRLHRLWTAAAWRDMSRRTVTEYPPAYLENKRCPDDLVFAETELDLPAFKLLPSELRSLVLSFIDSHVLFRYAAVTRLVQEMVKDENHQLIRLCSIYSWSRHQDLVLENNIIKPFIRLSFDCRGLLQIERISTRDPQRRPRKPGFIYILESAERLSHMMVQFKFGLGHLYPVLRRGLVAWDIPSPPPLRDCFFLQRRHTKPRRLGTIDTRNCWGITFLMARHGTIAIHGHSGAEPSAASALVQNPWFARPCYASIYMPITSEDKIVEVGLRAEAFSQGYPAKPSYFFRMERSGYVEVGPHHSQAAAVLVSRTEAAPMIFHGIIEDGCRRTPTFGAYPVPNPGTINDIPIALYSPVTRPSFRDTIKDIYFSSAPLNNVVRAEVFQATGSCFCNGIIFGYRDGTQRAVGQCRFGKDMVRCYENPTKICLARKKTFSDCNDIECPEYIPSDGIEGLVSRVEIWFLTGSTPGTKHRHDEWTCQGMTGMMEFWFHLHGAEVTIIDGAPCDRG